MFKLSLTKEDQSGWMIELDDSKIAILYKAFSKSNSDTLGVVLYQMIRLIKEFSEGKLYSDKQLPIVGIDIKDNITYGSNKPTIDTHTYIENILKLQANGYVVQAINPSTEEVINIPYE